MSTSYRKPIARYKDRFRHRYSHGMRCCTVTDSSCLCDLPVLQSAVEHQAKKSVEARRRLKRSTSDFPAEQRKRKDALNSPTPEAARSINDLEKLS